jgi:hypothetical protein
VRQALDNSRINEREIHRLCLEDDELMATELKELAIYYRRLADAKRSGGNDLCRNSNRDLCLASPDADAATESLGT